MSTLLLVSALVSSASLLGWISLVTVRGLFWRTDQRLPLRPPATREDTKLPAVSVVIPARNEADLLLRTLPTLLCQDYPGPLHIFLVDDRSEDVTARVARQASVEGGAADRLTVVEAEPLPVGWTGKLWALQQGVSASHRMESEFLLLTDADIAHPPDSLRALVMKAEGQRLDLVSLMAWLRVESLWDRLLIPAFVYFFAKLYPFRWANDPRKPTAAAAGGCILVRRDALERSGGLEPISDALIDDCALASRIKKYGRPEGGRIWLGLSQEVRSLREYETVNPIWATVTRTAFAQLKYSPLLLVATVTGMLFLYLIPVLSALGGSTAVALSIEGTRVWLAATGLSGWIGMAGSYLPMLRWHRTSPLFAPLLPLTAMLYTLMTVDSAVRWWRGEGGAWKGRTYGLETPTTTDAEQLKS